MILSNYNLMPPITFPLTQKAGLPIIGAQKSESLSLHQRCCGIDWKVFERLTNSDIAHIRYLVRTIIDEHYGGVGAEDLVARPRKRHKKVARYE